MTHTPPVLAWSLALGLAFGLWQNAGPARAQDAAVEPDFSIWDVKIGQPVTTISDRIAATIACGTMGGPASVELKSFADWAECPAEPTGLHEVRWVYDDEKDYIAKALESEFRALAGGTSMYAHPVTVSVLVDDQGSVAGIRVITDDRASNRDRRLAYVLARNLKDRFSGWSLACNDIPIRDGEMMVGNEFIHERCLGRNPDGQGQQVLIESSYLRKKGQDAISRDTQTVNKDYYESRTWMEVVQAPFQPSEAP